MLWIYKKKRVRREKIKRRYRTEKEEKERTVNYRTILQKIIAFLMSKKEDGGEGMNLMMGVLHCLLIIDSLQLA